MFWVLVVLFLAILFIGVPAALTSLIYRRIPVDKNKRRFLQAAALYPAAMAGGGSYGYFKLFAHILLPYIIS